MVIIYWQISKIFPCRNFYNDIVNEINQIKKDSEGKTILLLIGDWNEECTGTTNAQKLCNKCGLVNIFNRLYPNNPKFNTQQDGLQCIDYALTSPELASKVMNIMYEPFFYRLKGDHCGFFFDIPENMLFGKTDKDVMNSNTPALLSNNVKSVTKYIIALHKYLSNHNVFKWLWKLNKITDDDIIDLEKIDWDITTGYKHAENQCRKMKWEYWKIELHILKRDLSVLILTCF